MTSNDIHLKTLALMRHRVLDQMYSTFPSPYSRPQLLKALRPSFPEQGKDWLNDTLSEQLQVLQQAGLIRPTMGGYTLTDRGRMDRQQAARFLSKSQPPLEPA